MVSFKSSCLLVMVLLTFDWDFISDSSDESESDCTIKQHVYMWLADSKTDDDMFLDTPPPPQMADYQIDHSPYTVAGSFFF